MSYPRQLFLMLCCLGLSTASLAQEAETPSLLKPGFYLGFELGYQSIGNANEYYRDEKDASLFDDEGVNDRFFAGYRFNDNWSVELGYVEPVDLSGSWISGTDPESSWHYTVDGFDLTGIYSVPFDNGFNLFAKGGLAYLTADINDEYALDHSLDFSKKESKVVGVVGVGAEYYFWKKFALGLAATYQSSSGYVTSTSAIAFRLGYTF